MSSIITFKEIVEEVADREGRKQQVNIAQISEITKIILEILAERYEKDAFAVGRLLEKYRPIKVGG